MMMTMMIITMAIMVIIIMMLITIVMITMIIIMMMIMMMNIVMVMGMIATQEDNYEVGGNYEQKQHNAENRRSRRGPAGCERARVSRPRKISCDGRHRAGAAGAAAAGAQAFRGRANWSYTTPRVLKRWRVRA